MLPTLFSRRKDKKKLYCLIMPQVCCAVGCSHSSTNCKMKRFPSDASRAAEWEANIQRSDWLRQPWHKICECHFDGKQWEQHRLDGLRKLTPNAVPRIFATHTVLNNNTKGGNLVDKIALSEAFTCKKTKLESDERQAILLERELASLREENESLKRAMSFFSEDQVEFLVTKEVPEWSGETINKSLEMCLTVGLSGYNYLLEQGWPLPSPSVLERYWEDAAPLALLK